MFIVKKRSEIIQFVLFLVLLGSLVAFLSSKINVWRMSAQPDAAVPTMGQGAAGTKGAKTDGAKAEGVKANSPSDLLQGAFPLPPGITDGRDYFAEYRIERERTRSALGERLKEVMDSQSAGDEVKRQASQQYLELGKAASLESRTEAMIKAKGFEDVVVDLAAETAQVVVKARSLGQQQSLQIIDMVHRVTGVRESGVVVHHRER